MASRIGAVLFRCGKLFKWIIFKWIQSDFFFPRCGLRLKWDAIPFPRK